MDDIELENRRINNFLSIQNLVKTYPNGSKAVFNFDLDIKKNEFIVIVGPSGCGKSTTLRMIAGLEDISKGDIYLNNELLNYRPSKDRNIAIVFQSYALYPQMTVYDNIAFPLTINKYPFPIVDYKLLSCNEALDVIQNHFNEFINSYFESKNKKIVKFKDDEYISLKMHIDIHTTDLLIDLYRTAIDKMSLQDVLNNKEEINSKIISIIKETIDEEEKNNVLKNICLNDRFEKIDANNEVVKEYRKMTPFEIKMKVFETAKTLDLGDYLDRLPKELSGGQMQRVALGRAIVKNVPLFLMDEPLSNLDAKLRLVMRSEIVKLHNLINATTIYVTHDQTEAMTMASRIVVMSRGFVQQIGTPDEIYDNPKNIFVAKFIGAPSINVFKAVYWNKKLNLDQVTLNLPASVVAKHDNYYQEKLKKLNDINVEFDSNSSEYILKILSALNDEKKVIEEHHKKHLISKIASLFKKSSNEQKVNYDKERKICEEKISELEKALKENHEVLVAVRPEKLKARLLKNNEKLNDGEMKVVVTVSELLGSEYHVHFNYRNIDMVAKFDKGKDVIKIGDELAISFDLKDAFVFDPITGGRIC